MITSGGSWVYPHVKMHFIYIPLSSRSLETGSDSVSTFTTPLATKPLAYGKFTKKLKSLLKQLGLGTSYSSHSFRRDGATFCSRLAIPVR